MSKFVIFSALLSASLAAAAVSAQVPDGDAATHDRLAAMRDASTWGHPDQFGQYGGMNAYATGDYATAMRLFLIGARYADKVSQLSIGLMYLNGQGVDRDPARAWAWVSLAAERDYPRFVATAANLWKGLDERARQRARTVRDTLAATYDDAHAKPRMIAELNYYRTQLTGSRTGFNAGVYAADPAILDGQLGGSGHANPACVSAARAGLRGAGCGGEGLYADWQWDPRLYFKVQDAQYRGNVTVGKLRQADGGAAREAAGK